MKQCLAFLSSLCYTKNVWGPFLVIAPATQLQKWFNTFAKCVPVVKVVLYSGNVQVKTIIGIENFLFWEILGFFYFFLVLGSKTSSYAMARHRKSSPVFPFPCSFDHISISVFRLDPLSQALLAGHDCQ